LALIKISIKRIGIYLQIINSVKDISEDTVAARGGGVILMAYLNAATQDKAPNVKSVQVNLCQKLFFLPNMGRTCCVQKLF
jgi:hypothetical protein